MPKKLNKKNAENIENKSKMEEMNKNEGGKIEEKEGKDKRRIGIIGYGHLGQFLKNELGKSGEFELKRIWNRTEDPNEGVLALEHLDAKNLEEIDLVIEVAHPEIIHHHAKTILKYADLFIGSPSALANGKTQREIQNCLRLHPNRSVFIPCGALWGAKDIQRMANLKILKSLSITMIFHPNSLRLPELTAESGPENEIMHSFCAECLKSYNPKVLYDGPVRQLCSLAPNNVNSMACAAIAAHNLGFDNTRAKLIVDPDHKEGLEFANRLRNWNIIEYEAIGENGFRTMVRRENPAQPGMVTGENTYFSFLSSIEDTLYRPPGFNIC